MLPSTWIGSLHKVVRGAYAYTNITQSHQGTRLKEEINFHLNLYPFRSLTTGAWRRWRETEDGQLYYVWDNENEMPKIDNNFTFHPQGKGLGVEKCTCNPWHRMTLHPEEVKTWELEAPFGFTPYFIHASKYSQCLKYDIFIVVLSWPAHLSRHPSTITPNGNEGLYGKKVVKVVWKKELTEPWYLHPHPALLQAFSISWNESEGRKKSKHTRSDCGDTLLSVYQQSSSREKWLHCRVLDANKRQTQATSCSCSFLMRQSDKNWSSREIANGNTASSQRCSSQT